MNGFRSGQFVKLTKAISYNKGAKPIFQPSETIGKIGAGGTFADLFYPVDFIDGSFAFVRADDIEATEPDAAWIDYLKMEWLESDAEEWLESDEPYAQELKAWRTHMLEFFKQKRNEEKAQELGCSVALARYILSLEDRIEALESQMKDVEFKVF